MLSKSTKHVPKPVGITTKAPLELLHSDLSGKFSTPSLGKSLYYITFIDDFTRYTWVRTLKRKEDSVQAMREVVKEVERQFDSKVKRIKSDNGGEYIAMDSKFLKEEGIVHDYAPAYSHESNGVAERYNRTIITMVRGMLLGHKLYLWAEAVTTAVYIKNRLYHRALGKTPYEALLNRKPSIKHLQPFGKKCFIHIAKEARKPGTKLLPRAKEGILVGYTSSDKIYRVHVPSENRVFTSRQLEWDDTPTRTESETVQPIQQDFIDFEVTIERPSQVETDIQPAQEQEEVQQERPAPILEVQLPEPPTNPDDYQQISPETTPQPPEHLRRSSRIRRPPGNWWEVQHSALAIAPEEYAMGTLDGPSTYNKAMKETDAEQWLGACRSEMESQDRA
jgi:hypothetical protein